MKRITSLVLVVAVLMALFVMPAAAVEIFPEAALKQAMKGAVVTVKETEDKGRDLTISGSTATLELQIENNKDYLYQWEYLSEDGEWMLIGGANGSVYPVNDLKSGKTYTFRCVMSLRTNRELVPSKIINVTVD